MNLNTPISEIFIPKQRHLKIDVDATKLIGTDMSGTNNATELLRIITLIIF